MHNQAPVQSSVRSFSLLVIYVLEDLGYMDEFADSTASLETCPVEVRVQYVILPTPCAIDESFKELVRTTELVIVFFSDHFTPRFVDHPLASLLEQRPDGFIPVMLQAHALPPRFERLVRWPRGEKAVIGPLGQNHDAVWLKIAVELRQLVTKLIDQRSS